MNRFIGKKIFLNFLLVILTIFYSGCWDLTRYGENSMFEYKQNLPLGLYHLCRVLPAYTLFIWTTILPLSRDVKGGFMVF